MTFWSRLNRICHCCLHFGHTFFHLYGASFFNTPIRLAQDTHTHTLYFGSLLLSCFVCLVSVLNSRYKLNMMMLCVFYLSRGSFLTTTTTLSFSRVLSLLKKPCPAYLFFGIFTLIVWWWRWRRHVHIPFRAYNTTRVAAIFEIQVRTSS